MFKTTTLLAAGLTLLPLAASHAQASKGFSREGARSQVARPNPINKFHAIDRVLGSLPGAKDALWTDYLNKCQSDVDPDDYTDSKVAIPALLGIRICDGVMAIKARNAEKLNGCADDIEKLAKKMGVKDSEMTGARKVRIYANNGEWNRVVLELGELQQDIEAAQAGGADAKKILYAAGWLQGVRYTSTLINENYSETAAAFLREPRLAEELVGYLRSVDGELANHAIVKNIADAMDKIGKFIDVPIHTTVPADKVQEMATTATKAVQACVELAK